MNLTVTNLAICAMTKFTKPALNVAYIEIRGNICLPVVTIAASKLTAVAIATQAYASLRLHQIYSHNRYMSLKFFAHPLAATGRKSLDVTAGKSNTSIRRISLKLISLTLHLADRFASLHTNCNVRQHSSLRLSLKVNKCSI